MPAFLEFEPVRPFVPSDVVGVCFERDVWGVLMNREALPEALFDLRTGVAGDLAQRAVQYGIRLACVVPDLSACPERFREFAGEANRSRAGQSGAIRFFGSRGEAVEWLEAE